MFRSQVFSEIQGLSSHGGFGGATHRNPETHEHFSAAEDRKMQAISRDAKAIILDEGNKKTTPSSRDSFAHATASLRKNYNFNQKYRMVLTGKPFISGMALLAREV